ncbi:MAG: diheme cytochrome c [Candidatus Binatia bacterium]
MHKLSFSLGVLIAVVSMPARAQDAFPSIVDTTVKTECGACPMVYQPQMLPRRSWQAIVNGLAQHFGEDAALTPAKTAEVLAYLVANAGDAAGGNNRFLRDLPAAATPLRITETPRWVREHREINPEIWKRASIGSKGNCRACHQGAATGDYNEHRVSIPK